MLVAAAALVALAAPAGAQWRDFDPAFDDDTKPWKEIEAKLPAYPGNENLLPFEGGGASPHRFYIDAKSVSLGEDEVVRYTLVVRTAGGATNVTFEGIRCTERQLKVYALGHVGGRWTRARNPRWNRIENRERNNHHGVLVQDYVCAGDSRSRPPRSADDVLRRLKYGPRLEPMD